MMNLSFYFGFMQSLLENGAAETAKYARSIGCRSAEVLDSCGDDRPRITPAMAKEIRARLEDGGLPMACYSVGVQLYGSDGAEECLKRHAETAAALGSPYLHHTLILQPPADHPPVPDALEAVAERAARVAECAGSFGLTVLYEDQGRYVNGIENFGAFFANMKSRCDNVGVCADIGNIIFSGDSPEDFLRTFLPHIRHVHVKDYRRTPSGVIPTVFGQGDINIPACIHILREGGYTGALGCEVECQPLAESIVQSVNFMKTIL